MPLPTQCIGQNFFWIGQTLLLPKESLGKDKSVPDLRSLSRLKQPDNNTAFNMKRNKS